ncbi:MAG TPA: phosphate signaling complex protein PhoU [Verrucomicrobiota bacterium]|nr:phosphate signaling complex protein PhoU [Verrucomicrobiota bacterium]HRT06766.1 phosphate signaling complex protein PhoU [Candidatus Paceibacterota bacterium]HRT56820.1 phosphate signaling complex protein PhoU [Candidatus Paceibacterota bacterium]
MNTHPHLEEALQRDLNAIRGKVAEMARRSEAALKASLRALTEGNRQAAYSVILRDQFIDELEKELDRLCLEFLARHQPVAGDLRFIFATIQINRQLERIGDYAESIARQVLQASAAEPPALREHFLELGHLAVHMLRDAAHSFLERDADLARRTMAIEERANVLRHTINAELKELVEQGTLSPDSLTPLMTAARRFERVTDQAKNLCEEVLYLCTGEFAKHQSAEGFRILFVDSTNSGLSQMAEGIGNALGLLGFVFHSAGVTPEPVDPRMVSFMAGKGINLSRQTSKSLDQLPGREHYQVVVSLDEAGRQAASALGGKAVHFTWKMKDPLAADSPEALRRGLEQAFETLTVQIKELAGAILEEPKQETKP